MAKTQPLTTAPEPIVPRAPVKVAVAKVATPTRVTQTSSNLTDMLDAVPMPVSWIIFAISSVTLLIQIWNYFGS